MAVTLRMSCAHGTVIYPHLTPAKEPGSAWLPPRKAPK